MSSSSRNHASARSGLLIFNRKLEAGCRSSEDRDSVDRLVVDLATMLCGVEIVLAVKGVYELIVVSIAKIYVPQ